MKQLPQEWILRQYWFRHCLHLHGDGSFFLLCGHEAAARSVPPPSSSVSPPLAFLTPETGEHLGDHLWFQVVHITEGEVRHHEMLKCVSAHSHGLQSSWISICPCFLPLRISLPFLTACLSDFRLALDRETVVGHKLVNQLPHCVRSKSYTRDIKFHIISSHSASLTQPWLMNSLIFNGDVFHLKPLSSSSSHTCPEFLYKTLYTLNPWNHYFSTFFFSK